MRKISAFLLVLIFIGGTSFTGIHLSDEYKYVNEINGVRVYYAIKPYSPKPGKTAKKIVIKLKNSNTTAKTISFKLNAHGENNAAITKDISQCLKANEENLKHEIPTEYKEVKDVKLESEKTTDGGC